MKHKPYPKYKPSGIDWIGDIPEGWGSRRLKFFSKIISKGTTPSTIGREILSDGNIRFLKAENIQEGEIQRYPEFFIDEETNKLLKRSELKEEDILFVIAGATIGKAGLLKKEFLPANTNQAVSFVRLVKGVNKKFILYWLQSVYIKRLTWLNAVQSAQPNLSMESLGDFAIPYPDTEGEQQQIANYLDQKTAQIDDLIQKKEEMIKLLKEKRAAIINQAVTKGLDPNAKMKPSGIDWIGDIPEGWQVRKLAYISDIVLGKMLTPNDKGAYYLKYYLRAKNLGWLSANVDDVKEMWFSSRELKIYRLQKNDLLVSEGGEVGRTCIWNDELEECYIQNSVNRVRVKKRMIAKYFSYQFYALGYGGYFESIVNRISIGHLTKEKLSSVKFLVPPEEAQQQIADFLDQRTAEIDGLIQKIESAIAKLREYRSSLITAAVTGKIDVRENVR